MIYLSLANEIEGIRKQIAESVDVGRLDEFGKKAFTFVDNRLREMESECLNSNLKPVDKRWPELSRIAHETHHSIMSPELGSKLIEIENKYINL